jgi:putative transposase
MQNQTFKFRVKDSTSGRHLEQHATACNQVWNFCCQIQRQAQRRYSWGGSGKWPTSYDLEKLCTGSSAMLGIPAETINRICHVFAAARNARRGCPRFRPSFGAHRALGWVPFKMRDRRIRDDRLNFRGRDIRFWKSREVEGTPKTGAFVQDARGRWYVTFECEVENCQPTGSGRVGIDLGLKSLATCSDGTTIPALQHYRQYEAALAVQQRAGNKRRVRAIHAKIANARRHHLHEWSTKLARENAIIVVGNVNAKQLAQTRMAKSIHDASWSMFRNQLRYKASRHGAVYIEADERWTSQTCSACGAIPDSSPKGMGALGVRSWVCSGCGASHDRDVNAARNILRIGLERQPPGVEIAESARTLRCPVVLTGGANADH